MVMIVAMLVMAVTIDDGASGRCTWAVYARNSVIVSSPSVLEYVFVAPVALLAEISCFLAGTW